MPEWVVLLIVFFVLRQTVWRGRSCGRRGWEERLERRSAADRPAPIGRSRSAASLPPPDPVSELQRAWVEGRITDEQYEAGLDRVYRKHG